MGAPRILCIRTYFATDALIQRLEKCNSKPFTRLACKCRSMSHCTSCTDFFYCFSMEKNHVERWTCQQIFFIKFTTTNRRRHLVMVNDGCITMMKLLIPLHLAPAFLLDLKRMLLQKLALMMVKRHKRLKGNSSSNNSNCFVSW